MGVMDGSSPLQSVLTHAFPRQRPIQVLIAVVSIATVATWLAIRGNRLPVGLSVDVPVDVCHALTLARTPNPNHVVISFGHVRVAVAPGEQLGEALWACTAVSEVLRTDCPGCAFVELGGPGLCAFSIAQRLPGRRVVLHPGPAAADSASAAGLNAIHLTPAALHQHQPPHYGALVNITAGLNNLTQQVCVDCTVDKTTVPDKAVVVVNVCSGCSSMRDELLSQLLQAGLVQALVLLLPAGAHADLRHQASALVHSASAGGLGVFRGGFDGHAVKDPAVLLAVANTRPLSLYLARGPSPPPTLHVFTGLHLLDDRIRAENVQKLCRLLLYTAAARNLSVHVAGLDASHDDLGRPTLFALKLASLRHALRQPSVRPTDVVMLVDATDTLAQASSAEVLQRYLTAGAPVFEAATEANCWPESFRPWCDQFARMAPAELPNKWLNGGGFIARAAVAMKYVEDGVDLLNTGVVSADSWMPLSCACLPPDDQGMLACSYLLHNRYGVTPDYASAFFFSTFQASQRLQLQGSDHWVYELTSATPAIVHGNSAVEKQRMETMRSSVVPKGYVPDPGARFMVDGKWVAYGELCK